MSEDVWNLMNSYRYELLKPNKLSAAVRIKIKTHYRDRAYVVQDMVNQWLYISTQLAMLREVAWEAVLGVEDWDGKHREGCVSDRIARLRRVLSEMKREDETGEEHNS